MAAADDHSADATATTTIQLDTMSLEQLDQLKQREEARLQAFSQRFAVLRQAAARLSASVTAVTELYSINNDNNDNNNDDTKPKQGEDGSNNNSSSSMDMATTNTTETSSRSYSRDVFVPLTESVFVPGKIQTTNQTAGAADEEEMLLIDLGTGYFAEKNATGTIAFLQRKMQLVDANSENGASLLK